MARTLFSERVPPQDLEAEQSVLGSCLIDSSMITRVRQVVEPDDFYSDKHGNVFRAICALHDRKEPVDIITVQGELKTMGCLPDEGIGYLAALVNTVPTTANAEGYAKIVQDKAAMRRVQNATRTILDASYEAASATDLKSLALSEIQQAVFSGRQDSIVRSMGESLLEFVETSLNESQAGEPNKHVVPTGFKRQDEVMPLERGEVTVVPGASSMGKTTWMFNQLHGAAKQGEPAIGFSLEMSRPQVLQKMWAKLVGVNTLQIRRRILMQDDWERSMLEAANLRELPLYYGLKPRMKFADIRLETLAFAAKYGKVSLISVDYWQILGDRPYKDERDDQKLGRLVEEAKALAVECDCHVLILAQATINSAKPIPTLEDVKDSRAIVQAADNVLFLTRPLEFGEKSIRLPRMDGADWVTVSCNAKDPTAHGKRRGGLMFQDVMLGIPGKARMGPKFIIPYYIDLSTGQMAELFTPWPWDNEIGAGYKWE